MSEILDQEAFLDSAYEKLAFAWRKQLAPAAVLSPTQIAFLWQDIDQRADSGKKLDTQMRYLKSFNLGKTARERFSRLKGRYLVEKKRKEGEEGVANFDLKKAIAEEYDRWFRDEKDSIKFRATEMMGSPSAFEAPSEDRDGYFNREAIKRELWKELGQNPARFFYDSGLKGSTRAEVFTSSIPQALLSVYKGSENPIEAFKEDVILVLEVSENRVFEEDGDDSSDVKEAKNVVRNMGAEMKKAGDEICTLADSKKARLLSVGDRLCGLEKRTGMMEDFASEFDIKVDACERKTFAQNFKPSAPLIRPETDAEEEQRVANQMQKSYRSSFAKHYTKELSESLARLYVAAQEMRAVGDLVKEVIVNYEDKFKQTGPMRSELSLYDRKKAVPSPRFA